MKRILLRCLTLASLVGCGFIFANVNQREVTSAAAVTEVQPTNETEIDPTTYLNKSTFEDLEMNQALNEFLEDYEAQQTDKSTQSESEESLAIQPRAGTVLVKDILVNPSMWITLDQGMDGWTLSTNGLNDPSSIFTNGVFWGVGNSSRAFANNGRGNITKLSVASSPTGSNYLFAVQSFEGEAGVTYSYRPYISTTRIPNNSNQPSRNAYYGYAYIGNSRRNLINNTPANNTQQILQGGSGGAAQIFNRNLSYTPTTDETVYVIIGGRIEFNSLESGQFARSDILTLRGYRDDENEPPTITSDTQRIIQKDDSSFDIFDPVITVYDKEDPIDYSRGASDVKGPDFPSDAVTNPPRIVEEGTSTSYTPEDMVKRRGRYTVTYTVTDLAGKTATSTTTIIVNDPPVIHAEDKTFKVGDSYNPLDSANVNVTDFEDITIPNDKLVVTIYDASSQVVSAVNTSETGVYTVKYDVTDSMGGTATKTITVTIENADGTLVIDNIKGEVGDDNLNLTARISGSTAAPTITNGTVVINYPSSALTLGSLRINQNGVDITGSAVAMTATNQVTITGVTASNLDTFPIEITFANTTATAILTGTQYTGELSSGTISAKATYTVEITEKVGSLDLLWVPKLLDFGTHTLDTVTTNTFEAETVLPEYVVVKDDRPAGSKSRWRVSLNSSLLIESDISKRIDNLTYQFSDNGLKQYTSADDKDVPGSGNISNPPSSWSDINVVSSINSVGGVTATSDVMGSTTGTSSGKFAMEIRKAELLLPNLDEITGNIYNGTLTWSLINGI